jgi:hypothetical protein
MGEKSTSQPPAAMKGMEKAQGRVKGPICTFRNSVIGLTAEPTLKPALLHESARIPYIYRTFSVELREFEPLTAWSEFQEGQSPATFCVTPS